MTDAEIKESVDKFESIFPDKSFRGKALDTLLDLASLVLSVKGVEKKECKCKDYGLVVCDCGAEQYNSAIDAMRLLEAKSILNVKGIEKDFEKEFDEKFKDLNDWKWEHSHQVINGEVCSAESSMGDVVKDYIRSLLKDQRLWIAKRLPKAEEISNLIYEWYRAVDIKKYSNGGDSDALAHAISELIRERVEG